jgi:hypothetical protein
MAITYKVLLCLYKIISIVIITPPSLYIQGMLREENKLAIRLNIRGLLVIRARLFGGNFLLEYSIPWTVTMETCKGVRYISVHNIF